MYVYIYIYEWQRLGLAKGGSQMHLPIFAKWHRTPVDLSARFERNLQRNKPQFDSTRRR